LKRNQNTTKCILKHSMPMPIWQSSSIFDIKNYNLRIKYNKNEKNKKIILKRNKKTTKSISKHLMPMPIWQSSPNFDIKKNYN